MAEQFVAMCKQGDLEGVEDALLGGKDVNSIDGYGRTGLMLALEGRHTAVARLLLLRNGIDINICDTLGRTALHYAARKAENSEFLSTLLRRPELTNVDLKTFSGMTPLWLAVYNRTTLCVQILLNDSRTNPNKTGSPVLMGRHGSPIMWAVKINFVAGVELLLADPRVDLLTRDSYERGAKEMTR